MKANTQPMNNYVPYFIISFIFSLLLTFFILLFSKKFRIFTGRESGGRHIHTGRIPRLGGVIIFLVFWILVLWSNQVELNKHILGVFIASLFLVIMGLWDDIKEISWKGQLFTQIIGIGIIVIAGVGIDHLTNPWGGLINLSTLHFTVITWGGIDYKLTFPADLFTLVWIVLVLNTVNWLDGLDGLASGVGVIGSFALFFLSLTPVVNQPQIATLSIVLAGALAGFLVYNFSPAKIFLGTSGSMFLGFMLAVLAIISGGKVATALLILGFPILDALWVIAQRWRAGVPVFHADKRHFHHKLLEIGLSQRKIVLLIYCITFSFGIVGVLAQSKGKLIALALLLLFMVGLAALTAKRMAKNKILS